MRIKKSALAGNFRPPEIPSPLELIPATAISEMPPLPGNHIEEIARRATRPRFTNRPAIHAPEIRGGFSSAFSGPIISRGLVFGGCGTSLKNSGKRQCDKFDEPKKFVRSLW